MIRFSAIRIEPRNHQSWYRHLSHLIGLYPGYAVSNYAGHTNSTKEEILTAAEVSLIHRGNGTAADADAGWEKVWRAAAWAQLGNAFEFYHELTVSCWSDLVSEMAAGSTIRLFELQYSLQRNFGPNLFSLYNSGDMDPIFQIDANLGRCRAFFALSPSLALPNITYHSGYPGAVIVR